MSKDNFYADTKSKYGFKRNCKKCFLKRKHDLMDQSREKKKNKKPKMEIIDIPEIREKIEPSVPRPEKQPMKIEENTKKGNISTTTNTVQVHQNNGISKAVQLDYPKFEISQEWKPETEYACVMTATRGSGKTAFLAHHYNYWLSIYDAVFLFCFNPQSKHYDWLDPDYRDQWVFEDWVPEVAQELEKLQKGTKNAFNFLFIFDDCGNNVIKANENLRQLYLRGRNIRISVLISTQTPMLIEKNCRGNTDFYIGGHHRGPELKETVIRTFVNGEVPLPSELFGHKRSVKQDYYNRWLDENTKDHWFLVINYTADNKVMKWNRDH